MTSFHGLQERSFSEKSEMALWKSSGNVSNAMRWYLTWTTSRKDHVGRKPAKAFPQKKKPERLRCEPFIDKGTSFKNPCESLARLIGFHVMIMFQLAPVAPWPCKTIMSRLSILCRKLNDPWRYSLKHPSWNTPVSTNGKIGGLGPNPLPFNGGTTFIRISFIKDLPPKHQPKLPINHVVKKRASQRIGITVVARLKVKLPTKL